MLGMIKSSMRPEQRQTWRHTVSSWAVQAAATAVVLVALLVLLTVWFRTFAHFAPVKFLSQEGQDLGPLCPGQGVLIHNRTTVEGGEIVIWSVSTMYPDGLTTLLGSTGSSGVLNQPVDGTYDQLIPWTVPDAPDGDWWRVVSARGLDPTRKPVMITATFEIRKDICDANH